MEKESFPELMLRIGTHVVGVSGLGGGVAGETLQKPVGVKTLIHVIVVYSAWVW